MARNLSKKDRKMRLACMYEAWKRHNQDTIHTILSFEDGAWLEYKGVRLVIEEPVLAQTFFKDQPVDSTAYEEGRQWMRETLAAK